MFEYDAFKSSIQDGAGTKPERAAEAVPDPAEDVRQPMARIEAPVHPHQDSVRGLVFDLTTGEFDEVIV